MPRQLRVLQALPELPRHCRKCWISTNPCNIYVKNMLWFNLMILVKNYWNSDFRFFNQIFGLKNAFMQCLNHRYSNLNIKGPHMTRAACVYLFRFSLQPLSPLFFSYRKSHMDLFRPNSHNIFSHNIAIKRYAIKR